MSLILDGTNGVTFNDSSLQPAAASPYVLKNKLINGAMMIDQRANGASTTVTSANYYSCDRWYTDMSQASKYSVQQNAGGVTPPAGFTNYLGITSLASTTVGASDYFNIYQGIEGFNTADLDFGKSTAKTVTLSFWIRSSLTGTFGGSLKNNANNRSYPFSYTISSANTWTQISITIAGDTTGTWIGATNGLGIGLNLSLGCGSTYSGTAGAWAGANYIQPTGATSVVGTNGATFYITGVQLEIGTSATPFERRLYNQELANCQRYYENIGSDFSGNTEGSTLYTFQIQLLQTMRVAPTCTLRTGFYFNARYAGTDINILNPSLSILNVDSTGLWAYVSSSGLTSNYPIVGRHQNYSGGISLSDFIAASSEL